jgi:elongator complex protein 1
MYVSHILAFALCPNVRLFFSANLLLTPFRLQNIPPPMSSYQLHLSPEFPRSLSLPKHTTPTHVTFSSENDDLAILWESGYFEVWALHMRLVPGLVKILNPTKILGDFAQTQKESGIRWRQILLRSNGTSGKAFTVTMLGTGSGDQSDTIAISTAEEGLITGTIDFRLPYRNCRLVTGSVADMYQTPDGELFTCESYRLLVRSRVLTLESRY